MNTDVSQPQLHAPSYSRLTRVLLLCLLLATACVYFYFAIPYPKVWPFYNNYARLGDAFMHGHTYLGAEPSIELLSLLDPYVPLQRQGVRFLWDASLFQEKYYFYYGPVPALIWCVAYMITGGSLSDLHLSFLFTTVGTCFLVALLASMAKQLQSRYSAIALIFCAATLCFGTWVPFVLRRSAIYETAIFGGYCFNAIALFCLWQGIKKSKYMPLALASLFFGMAMSCRLSQAMNISILITVGFFIFTGRIKLERTRALLCLFLPWLICAEMLLAYNYLRFGDVFETGWRYALGVPNLNVPTFRALRPEQIIPNLYFYFFRPLEFTKGLQFPFFHVDISPWGTLLYGRTYAVTAEAVYGLFTNSPFSLWFLACPILWLRRKQLSPELACVLWPLALFSFAGIGLLSVFFYTVQRYSVDMTPWLMLTACLLYLLILKLTPARWQLALLVLGGCMAFWSVTTGILAGCHHTPMCMQLMETTN